MEKSFFKSYFNLHDDVVYDIDCCKNGFGERRYSKNAVACLKQIWTYMMSCKWHNTERTKQIMTYIKLKNSEIADKLAISEHTVRCHKSNYSAMLFKKLGDDCFDVIYSGDERRINRLIYKLRYLNEGYDDVTAFVPSEIIDSVMLLSRECDEVYDIKKCAKELIYLARYSKLDMSRSLDDLDQDKLAFVLEVLMGTNLHTDEALKERMTKSIISLEGKIKRDINL